MTAGRPKKFLEPVISLRVRLPKSLHERLKSEVEGTGKSLNDHIIKKLSDGDGGSFVTVGAVPPTPSSPAQKVVKEYGPERVVTPAISFEECDRRDARHPVSTYRNGVNTCLRCGATTEPGRLGWFPKNNPA